MEARKKFDYVTPESVQREVEKIRFYTKTFVREKYLAAGFLSFRESTLLVLAVVEDLLVREQVPRPLKLVVAQRHFVVLLLSQRSRTAQKI